MCTLNYEAGSREWCEESLLREGLKALFPFFGMSGVSYEWTAPEGPLWKREG